MAVLIIGTMTICNNFPLLWFLEQWAYIQPIEMIINLIQNTGSTLFYREDPWSESNINKSNYVAIKSNYVVLYTALCMRGSMCYVCVVMRLICPESALCAPLACWFTASGMCVWQKRNKCVWICVFCCLLNEFISPLQSYADYPKRSHFA